MRACGVAVDGLDTLRSAAGKTLSLCWYLSDLFHPLKAPSLDDSDIQSINANLANDQLSSGSMDIQHKSRNGVEAWIEKQIEALPKTREPREPRDPRDSRDSREHLPKSRKPRILQPKESKHQIRKTRSPELSRQGAITSSMRKQLLGVRGKERCIR